MLVWIVDDDVGFAYGFKNKLKAPGLKVEVFTDIDSFLKKTKKIKKEKLPLPDIVFIDIGFPDGSGTDLYLGYLHDNDPLAGRFYFCSAVSYGRFSALFESRNLKPPPFVQKIRLAQEWEKIVETRRPDNEKKGAPAFLHPLARRKLKEFEELRKQLSDLYYRGVFGSEEVTALMPLVQAIGMVSKSLEMTPIANAAEAVGQILQKPGLGMVRVKKEIRDFMMLLQKTVVSP